MLQLGHTAVWTSSGTAKVACNGMIPHQNVAEPVEAVYVGAVPNQNVAELVEAVYVGAVPYQNAVAAHMLCTLHQVEAGMQLAVSLLCVTAPAQFAVCQHHSQLAGGEVASGSAED